MHIVLNCFVMQDLVEAPLVASMVSVWLITLPKDAMAAGVVQMEVMKWLAHVCPMH